MNLEISWTGIGIILAILGHGGGSIWWAAKITNEISNLNKSVLRMDKELESRDKQITAAWKRLDDHGNRLTAIEAKCKAEHDKHL